MIILYIFLFIGAIMSTWGAQTRGSWSQKISIVGGMVWFLTLIYLFFIFGFKNGLIALFTSLVIANVCQKLFTRGNIKAFISAGDVFFDKHS